MTASGTVIVTGAGSGIGRATALALARGGTRVALVDCDASGLAQTAAKIDLACGVAYSYVLDLTVDAKVERMVELSSSHEGLGGIVHSAALYPQLSFAESNVGDFDRVMAVNVRAAYVLAKSGSRAMAGRGGSLVFLTSGAGRMDRAACSFLQPYSIYGASKAALDRWVKGIAPELLTSQVVATTITPGAFVETSGTRLLDRSAMDSIPTISGDRVGEAVAWLASHPRTALAGTRLSAVDFGSEWGPAASMC